MGFHKATKFVLTLIKIPKSDLGLRTAMKSHYSQPKGFVGRAIIYKIVYNHVEYGYISGGSATKHLPGRWEFFGRKLNLNNIVNNTFYHVIKTNERYPVRNFTTLIVREWRKRIQEDWLLKYGDTVLGFETLVELPRTGELYKKDGWIETGVTKGYTCKRIGGKGTDKWGGKRVWNRKELRPKRVLCYDPRPSCVFVNSNSHRSTSDFTCGNSHISS